MIMQVDVIENDLYDIEPQILKILLRDKTTGGNIIWATDAYAAYGVGYAFEDEIHPGCITGFFEGIIKPRVEKTKSEQKFRVRQKAEVFTPSWVCNKQNNLVDSGWFNGVSPFNTETDEGWETIREKVVFPEGKTWQDYVKANRLEISCGEAPYICSRYDTVTGEKIPVEDRIGLLDRKLRIVSENVDSEPEWVIWAKKAIQSVYGYDWQGDNVLLARENVFYTFFEHYEHKFTVPPIREYLVAVAKIVAWNIWQMDGLKMVIPNSCKCTEPEQTNIFGESEGAEPCPACSGKPNTRHTGIYCKTYDWSHDHSFVFETMISKGTKA